MGLLEACTPTPGLGSRSLLLQHCFLRTKSLSPILKIFLVVSSLHVLWAGQVFQNKPLELTPMRDELGK